MSLQRSLASNTPVMASTLKTTKFHSRTSAVNHAGFPPLLAEMLTQAFGYDASPDYLVFQSTLVPHLHRYDARVHISPGAQEMASHWFFRVEPCLPLIWPFRPLLWRLCFTSEPGTRIWQQGEISAFTPLRQK